MTQAYITARRNGPQLSLGSFLFRGSLLDPPHHATRVPDPGATLEFKALDPLLRGLAPRTQERVEVEGTITAGNTRHPLPLLAGLVLNDGSVRVSGEHLVVLSLCSADKRIVSHLPDTMQGVKGKAFCFVKVLTRLSVSPILNT